MCLKTDCFYYVYFVFYVYIYQRYRLVLCPNVAKSFYNKIYDSVISLVHKRHLSSVLSHVVRSNFRDINFPDKMLPYHYKYDVRLLKWQGTKIMVMSLWHVSESFPYKQRTFCVKNIYWMEWKVFRYHYRCDISSRTPCISPRHLL